MLVLMIAALVVMLVIIPSQIKVTAMMSEESFTPRTFPYLVSGALLACSTLGFVSSFLAYRKEMQSGAVQAKGKKTKEEWQDILFPYLIFVLIIVYGLLFKFLGIIPATIIVPPIILWCLRCRKWYAYVIFYAFAAVLYLVFTMILKVPLR